MQEIHTRLLSILARLQSSPDRYQRGLAGWVEQAHDIERDGDGWRVLTADGRQSWFRASSVDAVLKEHGA